MDISSAKKTRTLWAMGNWKMNGQLELASHFMSQWKEKMEHFSSPGNKQLNQVHTVFFPQLTQLLSLSFPEKTNCEKFQNASCYFGLQNFGPQTQGAFTGELSLESILGLCHLASKNLSNNSQALVNSIIPQFSLIAHSERRTFFGLESHAIQKQLQLAWANHITPVLCVGETLHQKNEGKTKETLHNQLQDLLMAWNAFQDNYKDFKHHQNFPKVIIAYEPVWAIGTGKVATLDDIQTAHQFIKDECVHFHIDVQDNSPIVPVLYGGSVKADHMNDLLSCLQVDGVLVGGASLKVDDFWPIYENCLTHTLN